MTLTSSPAASTTAKTFSASERFPSRMRIAIAIIRAMARADSPNAGNGKTRKFSPLLVNEPHMNKEISKIGRTSETVALCMKTVSRLSG